MMTVDMTNDEVRFTAHWAGRVHYCFLTDKMVDADAGRKLSRTEAIAYVREHLPRYVAEARAQHGDDDPGKIVIVKREAD